MIDLFSPLSKPTGGLLKIGAGFSVTVGKAAGERCCIIRCYRFLESRYVGTVHSLPLVTPIRYGTIPLSLFVPSLKEQHQTWNLSRFVSEEVLKEASPSKRHHVQ